MTAVYVQVPEGMSFVNAAYALYDKASDGSFSIDAPLLLDQAQEQVKTAQAVHNYFQSKVDNLSIPYLGGRELKVNFNRFDENLLEVSEYDRKYGAGAAESALAIYARNASEARFDAGDKHRFSDLFKK